MGQEGQTILNLLSESVIVEGDVQTTKDIRIDGTLVGTVQTGGRLILGTASRVTGGVNSPNIDIYGTVEGEIVSSKKFDSERNDNHGDDDRRSGGNVQRGEQNDVREERSFALW